MSVDDNNASSVPAAPQPLEGLAASSSLGAAVGRDDEEADRDSALVDPTWIPDQPPRSSLTSLRSSIYEHVEEHGRTYHAYKDGRLCAPYGLISMPSSLTRAEYVFPNDEVHISLQYDARNGIRLTHWLSEGTRPTRSVPILLRFH